MSDYPTRCVHGFEATPHTLSNAEPGWLQDFAIGCESCGGEPAGIAYKPGEPGERPTEPAPAWDDQGHELEPPTDSCGQRWCPECQCSMYLHDEQGERL